MSYYHDVIDWYGGFPFEVSKPDEIIKFLKNLNVLKLIKQKVMEIIYIYLKMSRSVLLPGALKFICKINNYF